MLQISHYTKQYSAGGAGYRDVRLPAFFRGAEALGPGWTVRLPPEDRLTTWGK